ncbi:hypothetical protein LCGC14_3062440, partial [marine sediment metagenome]
MGWKLSPEGQLIFVPDRQGQGDGDSGFLPDMFTDPIDISRGGGGGIDDLIDAYFERETAEAAGRAEEVSRTGDVSRSGDTRQTRTGTERISTTERIRGTETIRSDEFIFQRNRVYIDVPTPEEFLDDFSNAFAGFGQDMLAAGMSPADLNILLDPGSGLMSGLLNEYMGNLAQRAARGEDLFDIAGLGGGEQFLGTRAGRRTDTTFGKKTVSKAKQTITRMTRTQAEEVLRQTGREVTNENVKSVIDGDVQRQRESIATTQDQTTSATEDTTRTETGTTEEDITRTETGRSIFVEQEELFRRSKVTPIFKFSPTDFLGERFGGDTGMLA